MPDPAEDASRPGHATGGHDDAFARGDRLVSDGQIDDAEDAPFRAVTTLNVAADPPARR